jgi:hypothetical protein
MRRELTDRRFRHIEPMVELAVLRDESTCRKNSAKGRSLTVGNPYFTDS